MKKELIRNFGNMHPLTLKISMDGIKSRRKSAKERIGSSAETTHRTQHKERKTMKEKLRVVNNRWRGSNKIYRGSRENQTKEKDRRTTFDVAEKFPEWKTYPQTKSSQ